MSQNPCYFCKTLANHQVDPRHIMKEKVRCGLSSKFEKHDSWGSNVFEILLKGLLWNQTKQMKGKALKEEKETCCKYRDWCALMVNLPHKFFRLRNPTLMQKSDSTFGGIWRAPVRLLWGGDFGAAFRSLFPPKLGFFHHVRLCMNPWGGLS